MPLQVHQTESRTHRVLQTHDQPLLALLAVHVLLVLADGAAALHVLNAQRVGLQKRLQPKQRWHTEQLDGAT